MQLDRIRDRLINISNKEEHLLFEENRVVILGSVLSGAHVLATDFKRYLEQKGIKEPEINVVRDAACIEDAILGIKADESKPTLAKGVILLPEMRQYHYGRGMSLSTYECGIDKYVERLCEKYKIPLVEIRSFTDEDQITEGTKKLLLGEEE